MGPPTRRRARGPSPRAASPSGEANDDRPGADANRGKVALISGGGTGIGRATALAFASSGARVAICGRRMELLEAVREELERDGAECLASPCDVREPDQVTALLDATLERFGAIDNLGQQCGRPVHRAGRAGHGKGTAGDRTAETRCRLGSDPTGRNRSMVPGSCGVIVFLGFSPRRGIPLRPRRRIRAGLENLASGLALEWSRHGIRAVCVAQGNIETEGLAAYGPEALEASGGRCRWAGWGARRRWGGRSLASPPTRAATSPAPASSSTVASTPGARASPRPPPNARASPRPPPNATFTSNDHRRRCVRRCRRQIMRLWSDRTSST